MKKGLAVQAKKKRASSAYRREKRKIAEAKKEQKESQRVRKKKKRKEFEGCRNKIAKRKSITSALRCFLYFGMNVVIFLFTSMHVLNCMI